MTSDFNSTLTDMGLCYTYTPPTPGRDAGRWIKFISSTEPIWKLYPFVGQYMSKVMIMINDDMSTGPLSP